MLGSFRTGFSGAVPIPAGCSMFPKEIFRVSRGHFAAFEQPQLFVNEVCACFGAMRAAR